MTVETQAGMPLDAEVVQVYFKRLVNLFFKILPMRENNENTLPVYLESLQTELLGCQNLIVAVKYDSDYLSMLSILQYLIDHPECELKKVKREVFHAISICNKLEKKFAAEEVGQ